jgi:YidC/Oxa1 family membrane protein insertase
MDKRSFFYFTVMMSTFLLLNTFVFDTPKEKLKTEDVKIDHLPIINLKNTIGETVCKSICFGDVYITLSEKRLPSALLYESSTVHLMEQSKGNIYLYSDKISPILNTSLELKEQEEFLILTDFSKDTQKIITACLADGKINFLFDSPLESGVAIKISKNNVEFAGVWNQDTNSLTTTADLKDWEKIFSANNFSGSKTEEKYYCLENDSIQVIFSNKGAAISELNMRLRDQGNLDSPILPVSVDKQIAKQSPNNNLYPLHKTFIADSKENSSFMENKTGGYMPLFRRDILNNNGEILFKVDPKYYALALTKADNNYIPTYSVTKFTKNYIEFKGKIDGKEITRRYSLAENAPYLINMENSIVGDITSLRISSGIPEVEIDSGSPTSSLLYYNYNGRKMKLADFKLPKDIFTKNDIDPSWTANCNSFFTSILHPRNNSAKGITLEKVMGENTLSRLTLVNINGNFYSKEKFPGYIIQTPIKFSSTPSSYYFYGGPLDKNVLANVDQALTDKTTGSNPEFVKVITVRGWLTFISDPFARFMNIILNFFDKITNSWGISIILLTVVLKLILYPFTAKAFKAMQKMKKIAPKQKEIESKYKNDPKRLRIELSMLYRNEGINPLTSFLPILLQLPFFIGMLDLIKTKFALRGAVFIPGWINDLSAPDVLFSFPVNIPFIGNQFHLLPVIGAVFMYLAQKYTSSLQDKKKVLTDMEKQMQLMMGPIASVLFLVFLYNSASGLNIYFTVSTILGIAQQWYMNHKFGEKNLNITVVKN